MNFFVQRSQYFFETYIKRLNIRGDKTKFNKKRMSFINYIIDVSAII